MHADAYACVSLYLRSSGQMTRTASSRSVALLCRTTSAILWSKRTFHSCTRSVGKGRSGGLVAMGVSFSSGDRTHPGADEPDFQGDQQMLQARGPQCRRLLRRSRNWQVSPDADELAAGRAQRPGCLPLCSRDWSVARVTDRLHVGKQRDEGFSLYEGRSQKAPAAGPVFKPGLDTGMRGGTFT